MWSAGQETSTKKIKSKLLRSDLRRLFVLVLIRITKKCVKTPDCYFKGVGYIYCEFMNIYIINGDQQYF